MIKRLKRRVILLVALGLFTLLFLIVSAVNIITFRSVTKSIDEVLDLIVQHGGNFPDGKLPTEDNYSPIPLPPDMSPEVPYESRFFTVTMDAEGEIISTDTKNIASVDGDDATGYAKMAVIGNAQRGFVGTFRFLRADLDEGTSYTFLDCGRRLETYGLFLLVSIGIALLALALVLVMMLIFSDRIIRPIAESYEKQKQFITDAGHEIKTPLAIIAANADLLEMEHGEDESIDEIKNQTKRLGLLTANLVRLAKMEEDGAGISKMEFPLSRGVEEIASEYRAPALTGDKSIRLSVEKDISINADERLIRQLISILLDNAIKYSPGGTAIDLSLASRPYRIIFSITNETEEQIEQADLERVFDRFYRTDSSRNSETGGHGIGLSLARAIVQSHGGRIAATTKGDRDFTVTLSLPLGHRPGIIRKL